MNQECISVLTLAVFAAGDRLKADPAKWHKVFYDLKQAGVDPEIFDQIRFTDPSGARPYSPEVERLLYQITRTGASIRENPRLQVLAIRREAKDQTRERYEKLCSSRSATIRRVAEAIREELQATEPDEQG